MDLGIVAAVASSFKERPIDPKTLVIGKSVSAERSVRCTSPIRGSGGCADGVVWCILPDRNLERLTDRHGLNSIGVHHLREALGALLSNSHSAPRSLQLVREQRRADTNRQVKFHSIEGAPAYWRFFKATRIFILPIFVLISTGCFGNRVKPTEQPLILKNWTSDEILDIISRRAGAIQQVKTLITVKIDGKRPPGFFLPCRVSRPLCGQNGRTRSGCRGFSPLANTF